MRTRFYKKETTLSDFPVSLERKTNKPRLFSLLALVCILLFGGIFLFSKMSGNKTAAVPTPTLSAPSPTVTDTPTPTASVSASPSPKLSVTPTGKASGSVDSATGLDRAKLSVAVQNGSGTPGAASGIAAALKKLGYAIASTGNADSFTYKNVTIQVKSTKAPYLSLLKNDLSTDYTIGSATKDYPASSSADAVVIIGK